MKKKFKKILIPLREHIAYRFTKALPLRLLDELKILFNIKPKLRHKLLPVNIDLIKHFGHISDDDAYINIDSHAAITWYRARGFEILSHSFLLLPRFLQSWSSNSKENEFQIGVEIGRLKGNRRDTDRQREINKRVGCFCSHLWSDPVLCTNCHERFGFGFSLLLFRTMGRVLHWAFPAQRRMRDIISKYKSNVY